MAYLGMACASLVVELSGLFPGVFPYAFEPMAYLSLSFIILFLGFSGFKDNRFSAIKLDNIYLFRVLENILIIGGFLAIGFFLPFAWRALTGDIEQNRIQIVYQQELLGRWGIINSIFSLLANLFILAQVCSFINLMPRNGKRNIIRAYLLLFSSFSYVVYILAYVGRDGVIFWIMSFVFCFIFFKDFLIKNDLRRIKRLFIYILPALAIPFILISVARFSERVGGVGWNIVNYGGQQLKNFNDSYPIDAPILYGRWGFPVFIKIVESTGFGVKVGPEPVERSYYYLNYGVDPWTFNTFIGSLIGDFGKIGTLVFLCLLSLISRSITKEVSATGIFRLSKIVLFILVYQIVYWGVFYFRMYSANYYVLFLILLFISFRVVHSSRCSFLFYKTAKADYKGL
ncbi:MAG: O-antigen polymerase [Candidatus Aminicenantales bacterium]